MLRYTYIALLFRVHLSAEYSARVHKIQPPISVWSVLPHLVYIVDVTWLVYQTTIASEKVVELCFKFVAV